MMTTRHLRNMCVDAGNISVMDESMIKENGGTVTDRKDLGQKIKLRGGPGQYKMTLYVPKTWMGSTVKEFDFTSKTGVVVVGDACYNWSGKVAYDVWLAFLYKTDYLKDDMEGFTSLSTGGDGSFTVHLSYEKTADLK